MNYIDQDSDFFGIVEAEKPSKKMIPRKEYFVDLVYGAILFVTILFAIVVAIVISLAIYFF